MITQIVIDNFHPVAKPIAAFVKTMTFGPQEYGGHIYKGVGIGYAPEMFYELLEAAIGQKVTPKLDFFRLGTKEDSSTTYIHPDSGMAKFAAVWYLTEAPGDIVAGTAFWKNKGTGKDALSEQDRMNELLLAQLDAEGADESKWKMTGLVGQKFNRLVVYPSHLFHSRYPQDAWGKDASDGRIIFCSFFN